LAGIELGYAKDGRLPMFFFSICAIWAEALFDWDIWSDEKKTEVLLKRTCRDTVLFLLDLLATL